jgi:ATP-binding cassette subfamily D (ALD) long-chain fatty acid import protein
VETLTVSLTDLWTNLFKPAFDICYNTVMLYQTLGMSGVSYTSGYMLVAFGLMRFIVPNFRALTRKQFDLESRFRAVHNRLVDHTESIAFFGGDDVEKRIVDERFEVPPSLPLTQTPGPHAACAPPRAAVSALIAFGFAATARARRVDGVRHAEVQHLQQLHDPPDARHHCFLPPHVLLALGL